MNFKEIRLFNNAESHFQAQVAQGFIKLEPFSSLYKEKRPW